MVFHVLMLRALDGLTIGRPPFGFMQETLMAKLGRSQLMNPERRRSAGLMSSSVTLDHMGRVDDG
jgi:hypothetical protein